MEARLHYGGSAAAPRTAGCGRRCPDGVGGEPSGQATVAWPEHTRVIRGYEAGRAGWWLQRLFVRHGREHTVVDSASLEVHRRYRRAQTDRLDVPTRLRRRRYAAGARQVWRVVRVPRGAEAGRRPLHRVLLTAQRDRTRVSKRMQGWLAG